MPEHGKNIPEVFADTAARKLHAAQVRFSGQALSAESPREVYLAGCQQIANAFAEDGFKYTPSSRKITRKTSDFSFQISFQSSHNNVAGELIALWIHAGVRSKRLKSWRVAQTRALRPDDFVAGGQIGNLLPKASWMEWNLANPAKRTAIISDAVATIRRVILPYFNRFEDVPSFCERLTTDDIPGMSMGLPIEFLLCFANRQHAILSMHRYLRARSDILLQYNRWLETFKRDGLPVVQSPAYAVQLAFLTIAYELPTP